MKGIILCFFFFPVSFHFLLVFWITEFCFPWPLICHPKQWNFTQACWGHDGSYKFGATACQSILLPWSSQSAPCCGPCKCQQLELLGFSLAGPQDGCSHDVFNVGSYIGSFLPLSQAVGWDYIDPRPTGERW